MSAPFVVEMVVVAGLLFGIPNAGAGPVDGRQPAAATKEEWDWLEDGEPPLAAGPPAALAQQSWTRCNASEADGVSLDVRISGCTTVIQSGRNLALAYVRRGNAYRAKGQLDRAIQDFDQAIIFIPNITYNNRQNATVEQLLRGVVPDPKGQLDRAAQASAAAFVYFNRGIAYSDQGQLDRAIQDFDQAITLGSGNTYAYFKRGRAYEAKGQLDRALQDLDRAVELRPSDADLYHA